MRWSTEALPETFQNEKYGLVTQSTMRKRWPHALHYGTLIAPH